MGGGVIFNISCFFYNVFIKKLKDNLSSPFLSLISKLELYIKIIEILWTK